MKVTNVKKIDNAGAVKASFNVELNTELGHIMILRGLKLLQSNGKTWVNYPSTKYTDTESGETKYFAHIAMQDKNGHFALQKQILELLKKSPEFSPTPQVHVQPAEEHLDESLIPF